MNIRKLTASMAIFLLASGLALASPATATYSGSAGRIAYQGFDDSLGRLELFTVARDGSDSKQLTFFDADIETPDWSPSGSRIAFGSDLAGSIHVFAIDADNGALTQLTAGDGLETTPVWSPDGTHLAIDREEAGLPNGIYLLNVATGAMTPVTENPYGMFDTEPSYSPDGNQLAFVRVRRFNPRQGGLTAVFVVNTDGSGLRQLTPWGMNAGAPDWSPDGSLIAFNDADDRFKTASIFVIRPNGSGLEKLTHEANAGAFRPCWSPAGDKILFTRLPWGGHGGAFSFDLYAMNPDGSDATRVTNTAGFENQGDWGTHQ